MSKRKNCETGCGRLAIPGDAYCGDCGPEIRAWPDKPQRGETTPADKPASEDPS